MIELVAGTVGLIALHECGHAATARGLGYRPKMVLRLRPIPHPAVRMLLPTRHRDDVLIALSGPLVSVLAGLGLCAGGVTMLGLMSILEMGLLSLLPFRYFDGYRLRCHAPTTER